MFYRVYSTIIGKWNSSVANVFIDAFNLKEKGKDRKIFKTEMFDFVTKVMKIDLEIIDTSPL